MTHHCDRSLVCSLIIDTIDRLEQVSRTRELIDIFWDINFKLDKTEREWHKVEILLESYEKMRDESLEAALSNLKQLGRILACYGE